MKSRPLMERVDNYIMFFGMPSDRMIPIHPSEKLPEIVKVQNELNVILYPLGQKPKMENAS